MSPQALLARRVALWSLAAMILLLSANIFGITRLELQSRAVLWAISTLPDLDSNRTLVHGLRLNHPASPVAVAIRDETQEQQLQSLESATLLFPFRDAVELVAEQLCQRIHTQESGI